MPDAGAGKIEILLTEGAEGTSREGVWLSCTKAANVTEGTYELTDACSDERIDLNSIGSASELERAARIIAEKSVAPDTTVQTDAEGKAVFSGLDVGVYLIQALDDSGYDEITPFLIAVPTWSEEEGTMLYEITVKPKHTPRPEESEEKRHAPQTGVFSPVLLFFGTAAALFTLGIMMNLPGGKKESDEKD
ncbi:MAG TPA: hypothetical protein H9955_04625 [Candidatus Mediterraneibacter cottocaccae]|nr:hypothetical protein [Candidatus Mediterraneibacter cottocaccae]